jgi:hypothetical protein
MIPSVTTKAAATMHNAAIPPVMELDPSITHCTFLHTFFMIGTLYYFIMLNPAKKALSTSIGLSSLRSRPSRLSESDGGQAQLEYWNDGIMGDLVLSNVKEGKWDSGLPC